MGGGFPDRVAVDSAIIGIAGRIAGLAGAAQPLTMETLAAIRELNRIYRIFLLDLSAGAN